MNSMGITVTIENMRELQRVYICAIFQCFHSFPTPMQINIEEKPCTQQCNNLKKQREKKTLKKRGNSSNGLLNVFWMLLTIFTHMCDLKVNEPNHNSNSIFLRSNDHMQYNNGKDL